MESEAIRDKFDFSAVGGKSVRFLIFRCRSQRFVPEHSHMT